MRGCSSRTRDWPRNEALGEFISSVAPAPDLAADLAADRIAGVARLEAAYKGIAIERQAGVNVVEVVSAAPGAGFLTPPSGDRVAALRGFVTANADAYGLAASGIGELQPVADYMNPAGNMGVGRIRADASTACPFSRV